MFLYGVYVNARSRFSGCFGAGHVCAIAAALLCCFGPCMLTAQTTGTFSNRRTRVVDAGKPAQLLDSLSIASPLLSVSDSASGQLLDPDIFSLQNKMLYTDTARLRIVCPNCSRLKITYRVLPFDLGAPLARLDTAAIRRNARNNDIEYDYTPYEPSTKPWETAGLTSNGSYTRGLSFGNSQNLVFNSNLNLQLSGKLGNDLEILGALSDNSIPLQPDGTTRQLQEFDRIFIQIKRKNAVLTAGDFDLNRPANGGYFTQYFKRLQGGQLEIAQMNVGLLKPKSALTNAPASRDTVSLRVAAAISKGKFARQAIAGQEGNQGPYRLQGADGERFIIVLAGTEKVYIDGQLLRRGLTDDYVIDYNLGEVMFTPRRLITKDSRIIIEFEYAVQTYLRSTVAANLAWNRRKSRVYFNLYSEQDGRNSSGAQELSPAERRRLGEVGDNLRNAYASGIDTLASFDPSRVLYRIVDSVICGVSTPILIYSTNPDSARYAARFSEVPAGEGQYVQALTAANGRVFRWVGRDSLICRRLGNFEPVVRLVAPELRQLYTLGAELSPFKGGALQVEAALSNRDLNRFSLLDANDDLGGAGMINYRQQLFKTMQWQATVNTVYEYTARTFLPLNPYRPAEFVRDWNTSGGMDTVAEHLARAGISLQKNGWGGGRYEFGSFQREGVYDGRRHLGQIRLQHLGFELFTELNLLETSGRLESSRFSRPKFDLSKTISRQKNAASKTGIVKIGLYAEREKNERSFSGADTLGRSSFWYDLYRFYVQTPENQGNWQFGGNLVQRNDFAPLDADFKQSTSANEANLTGKWQQSGINAIASQQINWVFTYRTLRILDPELSTQEPQETYLGRVDYNISAWKSAVAFTTGYELGSGQSPKVEFNYLSVNPGEGQYTWVDRNRDSILQVDEMEVAVFQDQANYVRVAVTTADYIRTNNVLLSQNLRLDPRLLWGNSKNKWRRAASKFSTQSTLQINRRTFAGAGRISAWNPFELDIADTALVTVSSAIRNVLYLNRANPAWDASIAQGDNQNQVALTTGFEQRRIGDYTLHGRINFGRQWSLEADGTKARKLNNNQAFQSRNYDIQQWEAGPKITWMPNRTFRTIFNLQWQNSRNTLGEAEKATQTNWNTEISWNPQSPANTRGFKAATSVRVKGTFADIRYTGLANTAVSFAMLEGLQDGRNFLWSLNLDRQLSKSMQMSLQYEGRKTGENRIVHVGRAQVRAIF